MTERSGALSSDGNIDGNIDRSGDRDELTLRSLAPALWQGLPHARGIRASTARAIARQLKTRGALAQIALKILTRAEGGMAASRSVREELLAREGILLGAWSSFGHFRLGVHPANTVVGRYASIAANALIVNENHPMDRLSTAGCFYDPAAGMIAARTLPPRPLLLIGHDVWIGGNAAILPGCRRIGHGAVIGAGAVVTHDVPPLAIVAGNPARVIRMRFPPEIAERWLASRWWRHSPCALIDAGVTTGAIESALDALERRLAPLSLSEEHSEKEFERLVATGSRACNKANGT